MYAFGNLALASRGGKVGDNPGGGIGGGERQNGRKEKQLHESGGNSDGGEEFVPLPFTTVKLLIIVLYAGTTLL